MINIGKGGFSMFACSANQDAQDLKTPCLVSILLKMLLGLGVQCSGFNTAMHAVDLTLGGTGQSPVCRGRSPAGRASLSGWRQRAHANEDARAGGGSASARLKAQERVEAAR